MDGCSRTLLPRCKASAGDFYRIELAPLAQGLFGGFRFEIVPGIKSVSSYQQRSKFFVGASLAEDISNLIEVAWQEFACKVQRQRLSGTEPPFFRGSGVFFS